MYGQVSADVQRQQRNWSFIQDCGDVEAAAILGSWVCQTQCVHVMVPKTGISKYSILTNLEKEPDELLQSKMFES
jgi:hypothetical protein